MSGESEVGRERPPSCTETLTHCPDRGGSLTPHLVRTKVAARRDDERSRSSRKNERLLVFVVWSGLAESFALRMPFNAGARVERRSYRSQDSPLNTAVKTRVCDFVRKESSSR
jgi:hypothetical protein